MQIYYKKNKLMIDKKLKQIRLNETLKQKMKRKIANSKVKDKQKGFIYGINYKLININQVMNKLKKQKYQCYYCNIKLNLKWYKNEYDQPSIDRCNSLMGHTQDNCVISCLHCNCSKGKKTKKQYLKYLENKYKIN